ncbi:MAG: hypothetical protein GX608_06555 [Lentisphaerae bacterium]|nr:hypothetical protein [Lentisphaerota bacterium]
MSEKQEARAALETIRAAFSSVEWLEFGKPFWSATVRFGERDHAVITVVSGGLLTEVLGRLAEMQALRARLAGLEDPAELADALAGLLTDADTKLWDEVIEPLFTACVSKLELPDLAEATGRSWLLPEPTLAVELRVQFVRSLPVVLVGRVLIGILVQAGNLLTRSTRI